MNGSRQRNNGNKNNLSRAQVSSAAARQCHGNAADDNDLYQTRQIIREASIQQSNHLSNTDLQQLHAITRLAPSNAVPPTILNAPTSLANLARLSGITLVPVNETIGRQQSSNGQNETIRSQQIRQVNTTISSCHRRRRQNHNDSHPLISQSQSLMTTTAAASRSNIDGQVHSLTTIPSIQLINQQTIMEHRMCKSSNNDHVHAPLPFPVSDHTRGKETLSTTGMTRKGPRSQAEFASVSSFADHMQRPNNSNQQSKQGLRAAHQINPSCPSTNLNPSDSDSEPYNVSLMRLMSILNNPALTITPVDAQAPKIVHQAASWNLSSTSCQLDIDNPEREINQSDVLNYDPSSDLCTSMSSLSKQLDLPLQLDRIMPKTVSNKSRSCLPKSASNLLAASSSTTKSRIEDVDCSKSMTNVTRVSSKQPIDNSQAPLEWLSHIALSGDISGDKTLSWVSTDKADLNETDGVQLRKVGEEPVTTESPSFDSDQINTATYEMDNGYQDINQIRGSLTVFGSECIMSAPRFNIQQLDKGARSQEVSYSISTRLEQPVKKSYSTEPIRGTKQRLYIPKRQTHRLDRGTGPKLNDLNAIIIEAGDQKEVLISERHLMLERMVEIAESVGQRKRNPMHEPDEIFVNRSKRVMSRIDTVLEKKKRRRFERICHRSSPPGKNVDDQSGTLDEDEDEEEDDDDDDDNFDLMPDLVESVVVPIQLPLDEVVTDQKRHFLSQVGLLSRHDKNKLSIDRCERRLKIISALALQDNEIISEDTKRFVNTIAQTGGVDIQLRTETNIKRNELPFIEGLNRNTSRIKMSYMSALGLDKRSKRTTLYKVTKTQDITNMQMQHQQLRQQQQIDLINKHQQQTKDAMKKIAELSQISLQSTESEKQACNSNKAKINTANLIVKAVKLAQASCRGAIEVPKDEYMKSLGLMAS